MTLEEIQHAPIQVEWDGEELVNFRLPGSMLTLGYEADDALSVQWAYTAKRYRRQGNAWRLYQAAGAWCAEQGIRFFSGRQRELPAECLWKRLVREGQAERIEKDPVTRWDGQVMYWRCVYYQWRGSCS